MGDKKFSCLSPASKKKIVGLKQKSFFGSQASGRSTRIAEFLKKPGRVGFGVDQFTDCEVLYYTEK